MKLYFSKGACSLVVRIIINELKLSCEYESIDLKNKVTANNDNFLTINPKGAVPTIQLNSGQILTENQAILQYLADTYQANNLLPEIGDFNRYRVLEWLNYISTEVHKTMGYMFSPLTTAEINKVMFIPMIIKKLQYIDAQLKDKDYLCGNNFTLPDAYFYVMLCWTKIIHLDLNQWPEINRYFNQLSQRHSIQKSLAEEGIE